MADTGDAGSVRGIRHSGSGIRYPESVYALPPFLVHEVASSAHNNLFIFLDKIKRLAYF